MSDVSPFLHPFARPSAARESFITIVKGEGAVVWDELGNRYVDGLASLWYCQVGHGRTSINDAIARQLGSIAGFHTFDRFTNAPAEELTAKLVDIAPMLGARVFLTMGGSDAVDTALKLARVAHAVGGSPERTVIVSRQPSYHGVNYGGMSATGIALNQEGFGPLLPDVVQVAHDDLAAVDAVLDDRGDEVAAIIAEPVIGAGGVYPSAPGYLPALRERCDRSGAFLILDEVICGFGRLGRWWGAEHYGVRPDMVTFAKGVTSGYLPVGGVLVGPAVRARLEADPVYLLRHGYTYSGHPTACAAGVANLAIIEGEQLAGRAARIGEVLSKGLGESVDGERVTEVRGDQGVWAAAFGESVSAVDVRDEMLANGVIARAIGATALALCPPLVITDAELDHCVEAFRTALKAV